MIRNLLFGSLVLLGGGFAATLFAPALVSPSTGGPPAEVAWELTREEIRSMDILDRPYRVGHFYGNTVRRRHHSQRR